MYDAQGREIPSPQSVCEGQCHDCQRADEGTTAEIKDGDVWLGGKLISSLDNACIHTASCPTICVCKG